MGVLSIQQFYYLHAAVQRRESENETAGRCVMSLDCGGIDLFSSANGLGDWGQQRGGLLGEAGASPASAKT